MKQKRGHQKEKAFFQLSLLVFSIFAFSFIIGGMTFSKAATIIPTGEFYTIKDSKNFLAKTLGFSQGSVGASLSAGLQWGLVAYGAGFIIGSLIGLEDNNIQALSTALAAGTFVWQFLAEATLAEGFIGAETFITTAGSAIVPIIGIAVAAIVFAAMYKDTKTQTATFECLPWQAPLGGDNCEACNDDDLPCSEYKCRSLGQTCEIVNQGTEEEKCVDINPNDVNPPIITPNEIELTVDHKYTNVKTSPPGPGFNIVNTKSGDGCLKAFTPLKFGIDTNEPSQCKMEVMHTESFDEMRSWIGGSNLFSYNHTEEFKLPNAKDIQNSSLTIQNGKDLTFFIRCRDKTGNVNTAEYAVQFCVDPSPDTTPPKVEATSIKNDGCVAENQGSANVEFYTNEPADCRWSTEDKDFDVMQNEMTCSNQLYQMNAAQLFTCTTELTGIPRDKTDFYIRCKDNPTKPAKERNEMTQSFVFSLKGSTALKLSNLRPNSSIFGSVAPAPVELYAETLFGCSDGQARCFYSPTNNPSDFILFYDTDTTDGIHTQRLDLGERNHEYYIKCVDEGGNVAEDKINFNLEIDTTAPIIARIYEEDTLLKIITLRDSECSYSLDNCDFTFEEGIEMPFPNSQVHVTEWQKDRTFHIKCRDQFKNEPAECSAIVRPTTNFL